MLPCGSTVETAQCPIGLSMRDGLNSPTTPYQKHRRKNTDSHKHRYLRMLLK